MTVLSDLSVKISADVGGYTSGIQRAEQAQTGFINSISSASRNLQQFGQVGFHAMAVMDRFEISNISIQNAMQGAASAQIRYNQALLDYGEGSQQAVLASGQLENAQRQVERANTQAKLSFTTMGLSMVGMVPQIISFGTIAVSSFTAATASVTAFGAAVWAAAPYIAIIGVAIGGLYYLWQKNKTEIDANVTAMKEFDNATKATKISADRLRESIEKPISRPSLMDIYTENVFETPEGGFGRRTAEQKEKYTIWNKTLGMPAPPAPLTPAVLPEAIPNWPIFAPQNLPVISPPRGMPSSPIIGGSKQLAPEITTGMDETKLAKNINEYVKNPRVINVTNNITVSKDSDPVGIGKSIAYGIGAGFDSTKVKI